MRYFKVFGSKCYSKRIEDNVGKFEDGVNEGIFLGYSTKSKVYKCYDKRLKKIVDSVDIKFDEQQELPKSNDENFPIYEETIEGEKEQDKDEEAKSESEKEELDKDKEKNKNSKSTTWQKGHIEEQIIRDPKVDVHIRKKIVRAFSLLSSIKPKNVIEAS